MRSYPFTAVIGSDDLPLALALCAVSPAIGGVLVRGDKSTAKSTMVRGHRRRRNPVDAPGLDEAGRRSPAITSLGRTVGSSPLVGRSGGSVHFTATVRAAPPQGSVREASCDLGFAVRRGDNSPGLGPDWIRIGVREPSTSRRSLEAMARLSASVVAT